MTGEALVRMDAAPGEQPQSALSIADLVQVAKDVLEGAVPPLWVRGEVSNFTRHRNGHWYFTLKDRTAQIACVVWARDVGRIPAPPDEGMQVFAQGRLTVYPAQGKMQLQVRAMEAEGEGLWRKAFERVRAALEKDGLLAAARKRPLPFFPRRVAVVTSPDGAALHDIVSVVRRRNAVVDLVVVPAAVQGEAAPESLVRALERVGRWGGAEVVIIGRGGGSREDLWAFNDERVARAIAACPVPVVSAVGHEVDVTIADLVADVRAATPSAAAEKVVPVLAELRAQVVRTGERLRTGLQRGAAEARRRFTRAARDLMGTARRGVDRRQQTLRALAARVDALSPLATLARGYAVAQSDTGTPLTRVAHFSPALPFTLILHDGRVRAQVREGTPA